MRETISIAALIFLAAPQLPEFVSRFLPHIERFSSTGKEPRMTRCHKSLAEGSEGCE
ncbi:MAG: hypothetical protein ABI145_01395 [Steroidobacteraceae bacterium]